MLEEGKYKVAKVVGCYVPEVAEDKTQSFSIEFELENGQEITWNAYLSDKEFQKDNKTTTMKKENMRTLVQLGFIGKKVSDLADETKKISELFAPVDKINVVVEHEEYTREDGSTVNFAKVKYVNVGYGPSKLDHKQAVVKFKSLGLDGELMRLQKELGVKGNAPAPQAETTAATPEGFEEADVPF